MNVDGSLADLGGGTRDPGPISFIFMQFLGEIWSNNQLAPPPWGLVHPLWEILDPPLRINAFPTKSKKYTHYFSHESGSFEAAFEFQGIRDTTFEGDVSRILQSTKRLR